MATVPPDHALVPANDPPSGWPLSSGAASFAASARPPTQSSFKERLRHQLRTALSSGRGERLNPEALRLELARVADSLLGGADPPDFAVQQTLLDEVMDEVFGYGPIAELMRDQEITDILINGPRQIYYEKHGQLHTAAVAFQNEGQLLEVVHRMLAGSARRLDDQCRMVDARLPDGSRLNAVIRPPALNGPLVTIRRFGSRPLTTQDLVDNGSLARDMLDLLAACVKARINILVSGGTATGKTTLLNALSRFIPDSERVVTIEDTAELELQQRHVAKMETISPGPNGQGGVALHDLVHNALRMRPDRIIVGECRGAEVLEMLQAMSTGHQGSMTTIHGNSPREVLNRIELMIGLAGIELPAWAVRKLIAASIHLVVQLARLPGGKRKVVSIAEVTGIEGEVFRMHEVFEYVQQGIDANGSVIGHFRATGNRPACFDKLQVRGAGLTPQMFTARILAEPGNGHCSP